ncbi:MAG TPA: hypothetical protein VHF06_30005, partial [Pseudonocardiaceae bacterium]|nr:hypothetical protein [Pseudonocardiaceae bacterium]
RLRATLCRLAVAVPRLVGIDELIDARLGREPARRCRGSPGLVRRGRAGRWSWDWAERTR